VSEAVQRILGEAPVRRTTLDALEQRQDEVAWLIQMVKTEHEWLKRHGTDQAASLMKKINAARAEARRAHTAYRAAKRRNASDETFWRSAGRAWRADVLLRTHIENLNGLRTGMLDPPKRLIPRSQVAAYGVVHQLHFDYGLPDATISALLRVAGIAVSAASVKKLRQRYRRP